MSKKKFINYYNIPYLLVSDKNGNIFDCSNYLMTGKSFNETFVPDYEELIDIPKNSKLFFLPETKPIGFDPVKKKFIIIDSININNKKIECFAVSAFLEPGYVRTYLPGADYSNKKTVLPLWAYTATGIDELGNIKVTAFRVEKNPKWDPDNYDDRELLPKIEKFQKLFPSNRLIKHLTKCAINYHCFAAKNLFLERWEAPLPISQACNAKCLGCLSDQELHGACASHERISFKPDIKEISEIAIHHLEKAIDPMVSFGQGCEGEPLTESDLIISSIKEIRKNTLKGTINLNTNGSMPEKLLKIIKAGLDSVRISINSVIPELYKQYYNPINYDFLDVKKSIKIAKSNNIFTMINYLIFPGVSDTEEEYKELRKFIYETNIDFIHFKNLCIDPSFYIKKIVKRKGINLGIRALYELIKNEFPQLKIGYFNKNVNTSY